MRELESNGELTADQLQQIARTRAGLCSRCGGGVDKHPDGRCPDGAGTYSWAMSADMAGQMAAALELAEQQANEAPSLPLDAQRVLDCFAEHYLRRESVTVESVSKELKLPPFRVRAAFIVLSQRGYIGVSTKSN